MHKGSVLAAVAQSLTLTCSRLMHVILLPLSLSFPIVLSLFSYIYQIQLKSQKNQLSDSYDVTLIFIRSDTKTTHFI